MDIEAVVSQIPEHTADEALMSIESIKLNPGANSAQVRCHLSQPFRLTVQVLNQRILLGAEGWPDTSCSAQGFLGSLRRLIHELDDAIASGRYKQPKPKPLVIDEEQPPAHMDIPVWDEKRGRWFDAEH